MHTATSRRRTRTGDGRLSLCRVSRRRPVQHGARQIAAIAHQCRGLRQRGRSRQPAVQVRGAAGRFAWRCAGGHAADPGGRPDVGAGLPADVDLHAADLGIRRLPDRRGGPASCGRDSLSRAAAGPRPRDRDQLADVGREVAQRARPDAAGDEAPHQELDRQDAGDRPADGREFEARSRTSRHRSARACRRWPRRRTC